VVQIPLRQNGRLHNNVREDHSSKTVEPKARCAARARSLLHADIRFQEGIVHVEDAPAAAAATDTAWGLWRIDTVASFPRNVTLLHSGLLGLPRDTTSWMSLISKLFAPDSIFGMDSIGRRWPCLLGRDAMLEETKIFHGILAAISRPHL